MNKQAASLLSAGLCAVLCLSSDAVELKLVSAAPGQGLVNYDAGGQEGDYFVDSAVGDNGAVVFVTWQDLADGDTVPPFGFPDGDVAVADPDGTIRPLFISTATMSWTPTGDNSDRTLAGHPDTGKVFFFGRPASDGAEYLLSDGQTPAVFDRTYARLLYGVDLSASGLWAAYCEQTTLGTGNLRKAVFLRNLTSGQTACITSGVSSACLEPSIDGTGRRLVFASPSSSIIIGDAPGVSDIFMYDTGTQQFRLISLPDPESAKDSRRPVISDDGLRVAFETVEGDYWGGGDAAQAQVVLWSETAGYQLCSVGGNGEPGTGGSGMADLSADGRFVGFATSAENIIGSAAARQIVVYDAAKGRNWIVSRNGLGELANAACAKPALSPNGRYLSFSSPAANLSARNDGSFCQVYRVDLGPTVEDVNVSVAPLGTIALPLFQASRIVGQGSTVEFFVETLPASGVLRTSGGSLVAAGSRYGAATLPWTYAAADLASGTLVTFDLYCRDSAAVSLPGRVGIRILDPDNGFMRRVSVTSSGQEVNLPADELERIFDLNRASVAVGAAGSVTAFSTRASFSAADGDDGFLRNDVYTRLEPVSRTVLISGDADANKDVGKVVLSGDGVWSFHATSQSGTINLFRRAADGTGADDLIAELTGVSATNAFADAISMGAAHRGESLAFALAGQAALWTAGARGIAQVSLAADQSPANAPCSAVTISGDGKAVAFVSAATNLLPGENAGGASVVYVVFPETGETVIGSRDATGSLLAGAVNPALSYSGRYVSFLHEGRIHVRDLFAGATLVPATGSGTSWPVLSADGRFVAYARNGSGGLPQVYRYDLVSASEVLVSNGGGGIEGDGASGAPAISATGQFVAFPSLASNLLPAGLDTGGIDMDVFVNDLGPVANELPLPTLLTVNVDEDTPLADVALAYTDAEGNDVWIDLDRITPPAHAITFELTPPGPGRPYPTFSYQAGANYNGTDSFTYWVADAAGERSQTVTIQVAPVNDPPVWYDDEAPAFAGPVPENGSDLIDLRDWVDDVDEDGLTFAVVSVNGGAVPDWIFIDANHILRVAPGYDVADLANPLRSFAVVVNVTDGIIGTPVELATPIVVEVSNVDRPPVLADGAVTIAPVAPGTAASLAANAAGTDPDGDPITYEYEWRLYGNPQDVSPGAAPQPQILDSSYTIREHEWTVRARARSGAPGQEQHSAWQESPMATILNTPPVAGNGVAAGLEDAEVAVQLYSAGLVADPDVADGVDALTYEITGHNPELGSFVLAGDQLKYVADSVELDEGVSVQIAVDYLCEDDTGAASAGTVTFTITGVNDPPSLTVASYLRLAPGDAAGQIATAWQEFEGRGGVPATGFGDAQLFVTDADGPQSGVLVQIVSLPAKGTLVLDGSPLDGGDAGITFAIGTPLLYQPAAGAGDVDSFQVAAVDAGNLLLQSTVQTVKIFLASQTMTLQLVEGWNAVAFPGANAAGDGSWPVAQLLDDLGEAVVQPIAYAFRNGHWVAAQSVVAGEGFVVFCKIPGGVDLVSGVAALAAESVETFTAEGWYLRGGIGHQNETSYLPPSVPCHEISADGALGAPAGMAAGRALWFRIAPAGEVDFSLNRP